MKKEMFLNIPGYVDYQISNFGNVKSLKYGKERILKGKVNKVGYLFVALCKKGIVKYSMIHTLVSIVFLNHKAEDNKKVIDHIDNDKFNNHADNLQVISYRENSSKDQFRHKRSSKYIGVTLHKRSKKWYASIRIEGKTKFLGSYSDEAVAAEAYQQELKKIAI